MIEKLYPADQIQRYLLLDLIVSVFLFYHVLTADSSVGLLGTLLLLGLYLFFFYLGLWYRDWRLLLSVLGGCALLAVFGSFYNQWILFFGIIFADFLGRARSPWQLASGMLGLVAMYMLTNAYVHHDPFHFLYTSHLPMLIIQLIIPFVVRILERSRSLRQELAVAQERLEHYIQEEERHRLARDLHDTLGQTLTMIKVKSELALGVMDKDPNRAKQEIREVVHTSRFALKQVRDLVTGLKHVSVEDELKRGGKLLASSGIELTIHRLEKEPPLSKVEETMLAFALREAITNIVKHSQAKQCTVTEEHADGWYCLHIEDDGVGLGEKGQEGHGLASIQERMRLIKGKAYIAPARAGGVKVTLSVPLHLDKEGGEG